MSDEIARELFEHLPDDELVGSQMRESPPSWCEIAGRPAIKSRDSLYLLVDDAVLRVIEHDASDEIVTYRDKRRVQTALVPRSVRLGSAHPKLN